MIGFCCGPFHVVFSHDILPRFPQFDFTIIMVQMVWCPTSLIKSYNALNAWDSFLGPNTFWNPDFCPEKTWAELYPSKNFTEPSMVSVP